MVTRLHNLDYLRGLCSLSIMGYHYAGFAYEMKFSPDDFIQKIGVYGVSIFYVLSGLTLFHVYSKSMKPDWDDVVHFFVKRVARIMPLLWAVTLFNAVLWGWPGIRLLFMNLTGLFSILAPNQYYGTGVWSIGNELSFYLLFPILMLLLKRSKPLLFGLCLAVLSCYCYYAFHVFPGFASLDAEAWENYVNPLNQAFLFVSGFLSGALLKGSEVKNSIMLLVLVLAVSAFALYPVEGEDALPLIQGQIRMLYTLLSVLICICVYKITLQLPSAADKPLRLLGEISYSLYLLHPVVWSAVDKLSRHFYLLPVEARLFICVPTTIVVSYLSYVYYESFFIKLGRKLLVRRTYKSEIEVVK